jgi:hypothetical protein
VQHEIVVTRSYFPTSLTILSAPERQRDPNQLINKAQNFIAQARHTEDKNGIIVELQYSFSSIDEDLVAETLFCCLNPFIRRGDLDWGIFFVSNAHPLHWRCKPGPLLGLLISV